MQRAGFPLALAKGFGADEIGVFAPQLAFPLAGLAGVVLPGNEAVVGGVVAAVVYVLSHGVVNVLDEAAVEGDAQQGGKHAFGHAVSGVGPLGVAPFGHEVAVPQHEAVGGGPAGGHGPEQLAKNLLLGGEIGRHLGSFLGLGEGHGLGQAGSVEAGGGRSLALPGLAGRRKIGGGGAVSAGRGRAGAGNHCRQDQPEKQISKHKKQQKPGLNVRPS